MPREATARALTVSASSPGGLLDTGGDTAACTGALRGTGRLPGFLGY